MNSSVKYYSHPEPFILESGIAIEKLQLAYHTFGELNENQSNIIWCFHALTANSNVLEWWPGLFGENQIFNTTDHFVICVNSLGSPYGSTSPDSISFPRYTVRDVVKSQLLLAEHLNIASIKIAIGGSFGGSQALEFAYSFPGKIDQLITIAAAAQESPWGIAIHESQRLALESDASFGQNQGGKEGLKAARAIGMLTYRTIQSFKNTQQDLDDRSDDFSAASYIKYQGQKFSKRFDALSYHYLTKCLDTHHLGRGRKGNTIALAKIRCKAIIIGITSDLLIPLTSVKELARLLPNSEYYEIESQYGHDGFLLETEQITNTIKHSNT